MEWLQLVYKVLAEPARGRTYIWRLVRGLGGVYLRDACCVLPRTDAAEASDAAGRAWLALAPIGAAHR